MRLSNQYACGRVFGISWSSLKRAVSFVSLFLYSCFWDVDLREELREDEEEALERIMTSEEQKTAEFATDAKSEVAKTKREGKNETSLNEELLVNATTVEAGCQQVSGAFDTFVDDEAMISSYYASCDQKDGGINVRQALSLVRLARLLGCSFPMGYVTGCVSNYRNRRRCCGRPLIRRSPRSPQSRSARWCRR